MDSLVHVDRLVAHLSDRELVVLDCSVVLDVDDVGTTMTSGRSRYDDVTSRVPVSPI